MNNIADEAPTALGEVGSLTQLHQHLWKECCAIKASRLVQSFSHPNGQGDHFSTSEKLDVEERRNFMFSFKETIRNNYRDTTPMLLIHFSDACKDS